MKANLGAALLVLAQSLPAAAAGGRVDQLEMLDLEPAVLEVELQAIHVSPRKADDEEDDADEARRQRLGTTIEYALSDRFQLGVELGLERAAGEPLALREFGVQFKWMALDLGERGLRLGMQSAAIVDRPSGRIGSETFLIAQHSLGSMEGIANLVVETEPGDWSRANLSYGLRLDRPISERFSLGIEAGGGLSGDDEGSHFIGAVVGATPWADRGPTAELGIFVPLAGKAPDLQVRLELDWNFRGFHLR